ncbi:hypothetical protein [Paenibacillus sp. Y412MC10]|uniref:hypothetical protein n=1 Tax=Geobacillus sp. (strain Y412MC10) TaxID=481743 RepID=UPI0011A9CB10|nr:hypothetical protein [Paenibacillus sp. Y412MC10]
MNLNNNNAESQLPTDLITGDVIPFGEQVVLVFGDSLMLAEMVIPSPSNSKEAFTLTPTWWENHVEFDRIISAATSGELTWEAQTNEIFGEVYAATI